MIYRRLFLFAILALLYNGVKAQKFSIGTTVGLHTYKMAFHNEYEKNTFQSKSKYGYKGGVFIEFPLQNNFSWAAEGYYSKKGRKITYYDGAIINDASYTFFEISALLRKAYDITIAKGIPGKIFFNVGPNINYWINGKGKLDANVDLNYVVKFQHSESGIYTNTISDANRWLYGLELGTGMETRIYDIHYFQLELRFTYGQTYLGDQNSSTLPILAFEDSLRSNYRVLSLILRYGIDIDLKNARKGKSTYKRR